MDWDEESTDDVNFSFLFAGLQRTGIMFADLNERKYEELVDWRPHLGPVMERRECNGCWAIVAADLASAALRIKGTKK